MIKQDTCKITGKDIGLDIKALKKQNAYICLLESF